MHHCVYSLYTTEVCFIDLSALENGSEDIHLLSNGVAFISSVCIDITLAVFLGRITVAYYTVFQKKTATVFWS